jgi:hypothetical protein
MLALALILASASGALSCKCAPLASCLSFGNGSWGCVCPFHGDGYITCEEQRFVTDVVVRTKSEIEPWLKVFAGAKVAHMSQRALLSEIQYVLELDSTNYDAMLELTDEINAKGWPYQVALLGSATSRVVSSLAFEETPPLLEVVNVSYNESWYSVELVANQGMIFISSGMVPLPCIHDRLHCCVKDYVYVPFKLGALDMQRAMNCSIPITNASQSLASSQGVLKSNIQFNPDGTLLLRINSSELPLIASSDSNYFNFSVGLLSPDAAATQVSISLAKSYTNYTVGTFTRQVATFVMMQVEAVGSRVYLRCWAHLTLQNASVVFVQYAWGDMNWIQPNCKDVVLPSCFEMPNPCQARTTPNNSVLELWVPIQNFAAGVGNLSLYFVVQQGNTLARVMTQCKPSITTTHCEDKTLSDNFDLQILQGLQLKQIYRGPVLQSLPLDIEPQTDTLVTLVARSIRGATIQELKATHTRTAHEKQLVASDQPCPSCVIEQLVLDGKVVSTRSCFLFGAGDETKWIQTYVGLVGSSLAFDILAKLPSDLRAGNAAGAWVNPVWPWDDVINSTTFLHAKFGHPTPHTGRRLLQVNSHTTLKAQWLMLAASTALFVLLHLLFRDDMFFRI